MPLRSRLDLPEEPLYLMDGSAFVYRAFYAFQNMTRSDGFPTNVLYIVSRLLLKLIREEQPKYFTFILDGKGKSFRHTTYEQYKAQRASTPEPLLQQFPPLLALLDALGIPALVSENAEADDYIASLSFKFRDSRPVVIVGADKDLKQCLHNNVVLWDPAGKDEKITTLKDFQKETGMEPESWPDYQALIGDSSDNIPGVPQVGPKTALGLMPEFPTLEQLFDRLAAVPPKIRKRLEGHRDLAMMCRELTRLQTCLCRDVTLENLALRSPDMKKVEAFLREYELRSLLREIASMERVGFFAPSTLPDAPTRLADTLSPAAQKNTADVPSASLALPLSEDNSKAGASIPGTKKQGIQDAVSPAPLSVQGSLLAPPAATLTDVPDAAHTDALPPLQSPAAVLDLDAGLIIASGNWQRRYTGPVEALADLFMAKQTTCVTADVKTLWKKHPSLQKIDMGNWFDISLAAYLLSPEERSYSFSHVAEHLQDQVDSPHPLEASPALFALDLAVFLRTRIQGANLDNVLHRLEMPLAPVLARMEERGIAIDSSAFSLFLSEVQTRLDQLTTEIYTLAGRTFNIRSAQQLGDVLFSVLELPAAGKTKGGAASTSQEALEKLKGKHPVIDSILEFRMLEKLRSTYLEPLPRIADNQGRIHTTFNQMATATGRLSSSNPNLQNIPIRGVFGGRMRSCFIAGKGCKLVCADYSQIELRVLAHLSQDQTLLEAFRHNEDIHSKTASLLYDTALGDISPAQRRNAKTINFGLIYGMGAQKLARELQITQKEAKEFMERYFEKLEGLKIFYDAIEQDAKEHGFVATMTGRRRLTPDMTSANSQLRSQARRQAINTRIQGSAADIIKLAMIAVENDPELDALHARLLLQIHDELVLEVPENGAEQAAKRLSALMEDVRPAGEQLSVPLLVDCGTGDTWADAH